MFLYHRRIGVQEGSTRSILNHSYFADLNIAQLEACKLKASYLPQPITTYAHINSLPPAKPYKGDQKLFNDF